MISSSKVFKSISIILILISLSFFIISYNFIFNNNYFLTLGSTFYSGLGVVIILVALLGPLKIIITGAQIPIEIKRIILVQAIFLPVIGFSLVGISLTHSSTNIGWLFLLVGSSFFSSAYFGFYKLSKKLPATFYISEMFSIIKSAGILGKKSDSSADKEFMFWTKGKRTGVQINSTAPNGVIYSMDNKENTLMNICNNNITENPIKATVLNFASYSCPHHRKRIDQLHNLYEKWSKREIQFLTIYTAEAHPEDKWKLNDQYIADKEFTGNDKDFYFYSATSIDDRKKMAKWLMEKKDFKIPIVLDNMDNTLLKSYNSWPIRLYVIKDSKVVYCGEQGPFGYSPESLDQYLEENY